MKYKQKDYLKPLRWKRNNFVDLNMVLPNLHREECVVSSILTQKLFGKRDKLEAEHFEMYCLCFLLFKSDLLSPLLLFKYLNNILKERSWCEEEEEGNQQISRDRGFQVIMALIAFKNQINVLPFILHSFKFLKS